MNVVTDRIDFEHVAALALSQSRSLVPQWLPNGRLHGHEFRIGGLDGAPGESLSVNLNSGLWSALVHSLDRIRNDFSPGRLCNDPLATDGFRASGRQHPVQDRHADGSLGL